MALRWGGILGLLCGWASAVVWSICLTVLEPGTEPAKPWHELTAGNNDYWVRDLRWMAIVTGLVALVLVARGEPVRSGAAVLGTAGWLAVDLYLDRADVAGRAATVRLSLAACAVIAVAVLAMSWRAGTARGRPGVRHRHRARVDPVRVRGRGAAGPGRDRLRGGRGAGAVQPAGAGRARAGRRLRCRAGVAARHPAGGPLSRDGGARQPPDHRDHHAAPG